MPLSRPLLALALLALSATASAAEPTKQECAGANENAQELRQAGKLSAARDKLALCVATSCPSVVREDCARRLRDLDVAQPSLEFAAKDASGNDLRAVRVTMDGQRLAESLTGTPIPVDPGAHSFTFESPGLPPVTKDLVVQEGQKGRVVAVTLGVAAPRTIAPGATAPGGLVSPEPAAPSPGGGLGTAGLVVGGVGLAGLAVGGILGGLAIAKAHAAKSECAPSPCSGSIATSTTPTAPDDMQTASTLATASTTAFIAGGALVAGGFLMWAVGGKKKAEGSGLHVVPFFSVAGGGATLRGAW